MVKRFHLFLLILLLALAAGSAADFAAHGFTQTGATTVDGVSYLVLSDPTGGEVLFSSLSEPTPERLEALKAVVATLRSWEGLTIASIRAANDESQLRITVLPSSLVVGGKELKGYLPGGLVFWYDRALDYDFRLLSGAYAIRMTGLFTTSADLDASMALAASDPATWLLRSDPEYAVKRIVELSARLDALEAALKTAQESTARDVSSADARLETALMTALNVGFLSGPKPIPQASVDWVVAKKSADPGLGKAALAAAAKAEKAPVSEKEIGIILLVKYGER